MPISNAAQKTFLVNMHDMLIQADNAKGAEQEVCLSYRTLTD